MRATRREDSTCPDKNLNITEQGKMKKYMEIALVAVVAVAIGKKVPVIKNYL